MNMSAVPMFVRSRDVLEATGMSKYQWEKVREAMGIEAVRLGGRRLRGLWRRRDVERALGKDWEDGGA